MAGRNVERCRLCTLCYLSYCLTFLPRYIHYFKKFLSHKSRKAFEEKLPTWSWSHPISCTGQSVSRKHLSSYKKSGLILSIPLCFSKCCVWKHSHLVWGTLAGGSWGLAQEMRKSRAVGKQAYVGSGWCFLSSLALPSPVNFRPLILCLWRFVCVPSFQLTACLRELS